MKKSPKILIADDKAIMRDMLKVVLREADINKVHEASNGKEAVAAYQKFRPDITFLDINMPLMNGLQVLREIRAEYATAYIVMVSGDSTIETVKSAISHGANGFIVKPYSGQKVMDMVQGYYKTSQR